MVKSSKEKPHQIKYNYDYTENCYFIDITFSDRQETFSFYANDSGTKNFLRNLKNLKNKYKSNINQNKFCLVYIPTLKTFKPVSDLL